MKQLYDKFDQLWEYLSGELKQLHEDFKELNGILKKMQKDQSKEIKSMKQFLAQEVEEWNAVRSAVDEMISKRQKRKRGNVEDGH